ncbi:hypothetical protein C8F01DRAFT_1093700 [Mycena amicta]|nr:hypothetical protein C8F01DRAFT_1093700 [Mycena amicta]
MVSWFHEPGRGVKAEPLADALGEERADKDPGQSCCLVTVFLRTMEKELKTSQREVNSTEGVLSSAVVKRGEQSEIKFERLSGGGGEGRLKPESLAADDEDDCRLAADWLGSLSEAVAVVGFSKVPFRLSIFFSVDVRQNEWISTLSIGKQSDSGKSY